MAGKAFVVPSIFTAIDKFSSPVKEMANNVNAFANKAEAAIARAERGFRKLTPALSGAAKQFLSFATTAAITAGIVAGVHFSIDSLKDYEKGLATLSSITGVTGEAFIPFKNQVNEVAKETNKSSIEVAKAFELIGSAKAELLGDAEALGAVTKAAITLSKASGDDLAASAANVTGVMNQFGLKATESERAINVLAAGSVVGAASISQVNDSMTNFGAVAASANITLEQSVALVEVMGQKSLFGAEAGTKLRGSILKLQQAGVGYKSGQFQINDALEEAKKKIDNLKTAKQKDAAVLKMFGAENITTGKILLDNIGVFEEFTKGVTGTNTAHEQAAINTNTLTSAIEEAKAAWVNLITGSNEASSALNLAKKAIKFVTDNLDTIVSIGSKVILTFAAIKAILLVSRWALIGYNVVLGLTSALSSTASIAVGKNAIALGTYNVVTGIATGVTSAFATAMAILTAPITLIILAIIALIALVTIIIKKWNDWGAALSLLLGPLGLIIGLIQSFRRNWEMITKAFKEGGILSGLKAIGATLLDVVLMPLQQIFKLISKIPGMDWAQKGVDKIEAFRNKIGVNTTTDESGDPLNDKKIINPKAVEQESFLQKIEKTQKQNVAIDINDFSGRANVKSDNNIVPINLTSTRGYQ